MTKNETRDGRDRTADQAERLADATADLVGHFVTNLGRLVTDVLGNSARVSRESQGLYVSVAKNYVREVMKTTSRVAGAVSEVVKSELSELQREQARRATQNE